MKPLTTLCAVLTLGGLVGCSEKSETADFLAQCSEDIETVLSLKASIANNAPEIEDTMWYEAFEVAVDKRIEKCSEVAERWLARQQ